MEPLAKLVVSLVELAETELAMLKKGVVKLGLSLAMIAGAGVLGIIGLCWVLYAIFLILVRAVGLEAAYAISGVLFLGSAGALAWLALRSPAKPKIAAPDATPSHPPAPHPTEEGKPNDPASLRIAS